MQTEIRFYTRNRSELLRVILSGETQIMFRLGQFADLLNEVELSAEQINEIGELAFERSMDFATKVARLDDKMRRVTKCNPKYRWLREQLDIAQEDYRIAQALLEEFQTTTKWWQSEQLMAILISEWQKIGFSEETIKRLAEQVKANLKNVDATSSLAVAV